MNRLRYYVENRLFEWAMSIPIVILAMMLFIWPQITAAPAFRLFAWALPAYLIGVSFLICGVTSIVALLVNGASMVIGPRVRAWAAVARALLMLQFGISTLQAGIEQGYPYTVQPYWFTFALAELWVAYRAVLDVRSPH
jgi:hypothetical protein